MTRSPRNQPKTNLQTWFEWFTDWIRDFVHKVKNSAERKLIMADHLQSHDAMTVARSVLRNTPGAVATWYVSHNSCPGTHLIIGLDNVFELKKFLEESIPDDTIRVCRTHLVSIQWLIRVGNTRKQVYKFKGAWLADLQGRTSSINAKASDVVRYLVLEILNLPSIPGISWEKRIDKYQWEDAIESKCRVIADNHQPHLKKIRRLDIIGEGHDGRKK